MGKIADFDKKFGIAWFELWWLLVLEFSHTGLWTPYRWWQVLKCCLPVSLCSLVLQFWFWVFEILFDLGWVECLWYWGCQHVIGVLAAAVNHCQWRFIYSRPRELLELWWLLFHWSSFWGLATNWLERMYHYLPRMSFRLIRFWLNCFWRFSFFSFMSHEDEDYFGLIMYRMKYQGSGVSA